MFEVEMFLGGVKMFSVPVIKQLSLVQYSSVYQLAARWVSLNNIMSLEWR